MAYPPPYYTDEDPAFARRIMEAHSFALLMVDGLQATHLPLLLRGSADRPVLLGHIARSNPMAASLNGRALAVFSGPHAYISAQHYEDPTRNVPTWNYVSVHVRGTLSALPEDRIMDHLDDLARTYEGSDGWSLSQADAYASTLRRGIIPLQMTVEHVQAFRKMSGNKPPSIQKRIIDAARAEGEHAFADEMTLSFNGGREGREKTND
jgi:transcriptional regulator